jgi:glutamate dehydrogenase/leucine dehydrogenase
MKALLQKFEDKAPEVVFEWHDSETDARGWVVINSLRGGAAGGGTRMRKGLDKREVESLAKTMEVKFTVSGPAIGGAKSGIDFDPNDPRKTDVLRRWYKAVIPLLKNYYGTGGDMNVDEIEEVIPITEDYGLWHPQEGVVRGFYQANDRELINKIGQLRQGVSKVVEDAEFTPELARKYTIADMITGYGVSEAVLHYYRLWGGTAEGKKAFIQGFGNVGAAAAFYLAKAGVKVVAITDREGGLINAEGFSFEEIRDLFLARKHRRLTSPHLLPFDEANARVWELGAEIFVPAAGSRLVTKPQVEALCANGLEVVSCGANVPFNDPEIFYGPTFAFADQHAAVIPDFIANCGMARVFAYLMENRVEMTDKAIFSDTSNTIGKALEELHRTHPGTTGLSSTALQVAISKLI